MQCCGHFGTDPDTDPGIFVNDLQDDNSKKFFCAKFFCLLLFEATFT
jgi:hypothetical protein